MEDSGACTALTRYVSIRYDLFAKVKESLGEPRYNTRVELIRVIERSVRNITKLQRSRIKIEVARCRTTQECFQGLRETCGETCWYRTP